MPGVSTAAASLTTLAAVCVYQSLGIGSAVCKAFEGRFAWCAGPIASTAEWEAPLPLEEAGLVVFTTPAATPATEPRGALRDVLAWAADAPAYVAEFALGALLVAFLVALCLSHGYGRSSGRAETWAGGHEATPRRRAARVALADASPARSEVARRI
jgi:hypothetical protein